MASWELPPQTNVPCQFLWHWSSVYPSTKSITWMALGILATVPLAIAGCQKMWNQFGPEANPLAACARGSRSAWLDNARLLLICLIVSGHIISVPTLHLSERNFFLEPWIVWSSLFHMPTFSVISGMCSKSTPTLDRMGRTIILLAVPYFCSKFLWWFYTYRVNGPQVAPAFNPFDTYSCGGVEWYLAVLIQWRLAIILLTPLKPAVLMSLSFVLGLGAGFWVPNVTILAQHRALSFFPFFVAGYLLDSQMIERVLRHSSVIPNIARAFLIMSLTFAWRHPLVTQHFELGHLGDFNFDYTAVRLETGGWMWQGRQTCGLEYYLSWAYRAVWYFVSFSTVFSFLAAVPTQRYWFSNLGSHTMYPYLLHPWTSQLIVEPFFRSHPRLWYYVMVPGFHPGGWVWILLGMMSFPLAFFLSSFPIRWLFGWVLEPNWLANLLFNEKSELITLKVTPPKLPSMPTAMSLRAKLGMPVPV